MDIDQLIIELQKASKKHGGETEVVVHCHGCCPYGHSIESMALGERTDEKDMLVIQV